MKYSVHCLAAALTLAIAPVAFSEGKEPPVPVRTVAPDYPSDLKRTGVSGVVTVKCSIDEHGDVVATEVVKTTDEAFTKPAIDALQRWKFKPATLDGKPIATKAIIPVRFVAGT